MRFQRNSRLDLLADALRRSDATWHGDEIDEWDDLAESEQEQWRALARVAATTVYEEISADRRRVWRVDSGGQAAAAGTASKSTA
jgi:hypothetical protein